MTSLFQDHWWLSWNFEFHCKTRSSSDQEWWLRNSETTQGSVAVIGIFWVLGCLSLPGQIQIRAKEKYKCEQRRNTNASNGKIQIRTIGKYKCDYWINTNTNNGKIQIPAKNTIKAPWSLQIIAREKFKYEQWKHTWSIPWENTNTGEIFQWLSHKGCKGASAYMKHFHVFLWAPILFFSSSNVRRHLNLLFLICQNAFHASVVTCCPCSRVASMRSDGPQIGISLKFSPRFQIQMH